jgi:hypothetical protein
MSEEQKAHALYMEVFMHGTLEEFLALEGEDA